MKKAHKAENSKSESYDVSYHIPAELNLKQAIIMPNIISENHRRPNYKNDAAKPGHKSDKTVFHLMPGPIVLP